MKLIRTSDDLLDLIADAAPTRAAETAIRSRQGVKVLGGFTSIEGLKGWIVEVKLGVKIWYLALWISELNRCYYHQTLKAVPWEREIECHLNP